ncbi:ABC transporter substrate-binding protein [Natrinema versiforme]|uniref:ABC transporter substrate-binding protein n=1 Tax=Natrinema versiforme TaxID=88724 RepID=A0A4P8WQ84_9EURY|nr:ABC transporter substrate-binding protein [Natrinema versiforme]QCS44331.1 ABC transporter substrate-binding protein [Natrinema versiforme]
MLAATAGLTVSSSGCLRLRDIVMPDNIDQLSVAITTIPADSDRQNVQIARRLEENFQAVGIDVSLDIRSEIDFRRTVLYDHEFDICIGRHPGETDPDFLYEALYSRYADESGWQNPFGFTNLDIDELLEEQRNAEGEARREAITAVLEEIATQQPFVPICLPEEHRVVRTDRFDGWSEGHLATRHGYLGLEPSVGVDTLRVGHTDARPTENLNPIAADYRRRGMIMDLLYDSVATQNGDGEIQPWLAESWEWDDGTIDVRLRDECEFHDGKPVTAKDVAFTYRFLQDTSLDDRDAPSPAPMYRGQVDAVDVESISIRTDHHVELPIETTQAVGERALLVPILPEHIWHEYATETPGPGGPSVAQGTTEAVVTDNVPPIGSGPFQFESRTEGGQLTLERFDDHFTRRLGVDLPELTVGDCPITIHPGSTTVAEAVQEDGADVTSLPLDAHTIDGVDESDSVALLESPSWSFYFLGFNTRKAPFSNPRFRQIIAQLVDKEWLCDDVFHGHARPIATPVTGDWVPESLEWDDRDPEMPFLGTDGEVDVEAVKIAFEDAGFRYDDQGRLRTRQ